MRRFRWLGSDALMPEADLRRVGWRLVGGEPEAMPDCPLVTPRWANRPLLARWLRWQVVVGVGSAADRVRLIAAGAGDVLAENFTLEELAARTWRVAEQARMVAPVLRFGPLELDLVARDGFVRRRALGLKPREFTLLWRLAETPGAAVSKVELLREVWRLNHVPETNTLAVHAHHLRTRLALFGLPGAVQAAAGGGYIFVAPHSDAGRTARPFAFDPEDFDSDELIRH